MRIAELFASAGGRVAIAGRRAAQRQVLAAKLGSKAEFVRRRDRSVDERGPSSPARATSRNFRSRLQNRAAAPVTRRQSAGLPAKGDARVEITMRGPSWTQGPGAARIKERLRPLQMPGYAMLPLAGASLFEAVTATITAPASSRPAAPLA